tara:strand:- start:4265 stop:6451 length:2187 start_codon:yes stop_codon:yes gene_type:complete
MKKIKVFALVLLILFIALSIISFIKLPFNALTNERIQKETNGLISLNSSEKQSLLLLPTPNIEMFNSVFTLNHKLINTNISIPKIEISRSLLDEKNISIKIKEANLQNIKTNLFENSFLLEDEIENLNLKILNSNNMAEIISNKFKYKGADISFHGYIKNETLEKLEFSIENLEIDEMVLLLDENYQKFLKNINFSTITLKGEYIDDSLILENFELVLEDNSKINLLGSLNLLNIFSSDLQIDGSGISSKNIIQLLDNFKLSNINTLPDGHLDTFSISYNAGLIEINNFSYHTFLNSNLSGQGKIDFENLLNSDLSIKLNSSSSDDITKMSKGITFLDNLPQFIFDEIKLDVSLSKGLLKIQSLNISQGESKAVVNGEINLDNFDEKNLKVSLTNFDQFEILPFPELTEFLKLLQIEAINLESLLLDTSLEITNLNTPVNSDIIFTIAGDINLKNIEETFLNINFKKLNPKKIKEILKLVNKNNLNKYVDILNYEEIQGNIFLDLKNKLIVIDNLEIIEESDITGTISGEISNGKYKGLINIQNININHVDKIFFETDRIKGLLNIDLVIPDFINLESYRGINGTIDGDIDIKVLDNEFALLIFMQSLSQDIEDFDQINELLSRLSKSFINQTVSILGEVNNENKNKFFIKNLKFTAPNGDSLVGEYEYNNGDFKITIFDIIDEEDLVILYENGNYSYKRIISDGSEKKPIEELIQKNINKLFENLLQ